MQAAIAATTPVTANRELGAIYRPGRRCQKRAASHSADTVESNGSTRVVAITVAPALKPQLASASRHVGDVRRQRRALTHRRVPSFTRAAPSCVVQVWTGNAVRASIDRNPNQEESMPYKLAAYVQVAFHRRAQRIIAALEGERGQGTVEYVGLILLVSLLMVGMVAAMKGFNRPRS
jgi:hypothetical protein